VQRGFPGTPVLVPNGVDVANFARVYPDAVLDTMRDALGKRMGDVFLVTTSRLVRKNACDDVIRALAMLPEHLSFVILGNGPEEVALKKLASSLDVVERVWFVGHIGHTDMPKYLKACDIFVRPSRSEGMGASFVEAMAAGLPVIATQEGGIADFLFDEKRNPDKPITGWAVEKDSPEDIARAVRDIMDKPEKVRAVVRTAKEMVIEQYDWDVVTKTMREQVFEPLFR
jgi:glycosyltransferase involved in cell wall biosynthesis